MRYVNKFHGISYYLEDTLVECGDLPSREVPDYDWTVFDGPYPTLYDGHMYVTGATLTGESYVDEVIPEDYGEVNALFSRVEGYPEVVVKFYVDGEIDTYILNYETGAIWPKPTDPDDLENWQSRLPEKAYPYGLRCTDPETGVALASIGMYEALPTQLIDLDMEG